MKTSQKSRRTFLKTSGLAAMALAAPSGLWAATKDKRPNIVWISTEDIGRNLGCYGDPDAITPTLDKLASHGARFTNAFTTAGVCAPMRSGVITGVVPITLGFHHMRSHGSGKKGSTHPVKASHVRCFTEFLREAGYYCANNSKQDYQFKAPKEAWDESSRSAHWRKRPKGKPFFYVRNFGNTHEGSIRKYGDKHIDFTKDLKPHERRDPAKVTLPPYFPDSEASRIDWANYHDNITQMDYYAAEILKGLEEDGLLDDTIVFFWADHGAGLPRAKRWLYDSGTHVPLIVHIPEKYRLEGQCEPGTVDERLVMSIDFGATVLNLAGVEIPDYMQGRPFMGPNVGAPRKHVFGARDRMDERYDIIRTVRDKRYRYIRNFEPFKAYYQYMNTSESSPTMSELRRLHAEGKLHAEAALFMAETKPLEELYDLKKDPHEVNNLADDPKYAKRKRAMWKALREWMLEVRDLGLLPEGEIWERAAKLGNPYEILRGPKGEALLERLIDAAILAGRPKPKDQPAIEKTYEDKDAAVRYWAVVGLGNLGKAAGTSLAPLLRKALEDASANVRIAAAQGLCTLDLEKEGLPVLERELASEKEWIRLAAAIALDTVGEKARPAIAALRKALDDQYNKYVVRVANRALNQLEGTNNKVK
ncbi:MAG: sulfatase-like hydrolase/transferase [Planctomycetota bacterium]